MKNWKPLTVVSGLLGISWFAGKKFEEAESFNAESFKPVIYPKKVRSRWGATSEPITIYVDKKLEEILKARGRGKTIKYDYDNPIEETSSDWVYVNHDSMMSQGTGFGIVDLERGVSSSSMGMFYDGHGNYDGDVVNFQLVRDGGTYRYEDLVTNRNKDKKAESFEGHHGYHEEYYGAEQVQYEVMVGDVDTGIENAEIVSLHETLEEAKADANKRAKATDLPIFVTENRYDDALLEELGTDIVFTLNAENWGGDPDGKLAKALAKAREKSKRPRKPLKIERLDTESFNAEDVYDNEADALKRAKELGCNEVHKHETDNGTVFMPCKTHEKYEDALGAESFEADSKPYYEVMVDSSRLDNLNDDFDGLTMELQDSLRGYVFSLEYGEGGDEPPMTPSEASSDYMNQVGITTWSYEPDWDEEKDDYTYGEDRPEWQGTINFPEGRSGEGGEFYARVFGFKDGESKTEAEEKIMSHVIDNVHVNVRERDEEDGMYYPVDGYYAESFNADDDAELRQQAIDTIEARVADYTTHEDVSPYWGGGIVNPNKYLYYKLRYIWTNHPEDREMVIEQYMRGIKDGSIDPQNPLPHGEPNQNLPSQWDAETFEADYNVPKPQVMPSFMGSFAKMSKKNQQRDMQRRLDGIWREGDMDEVSIKHIYYSLGALGAGRDWHTQTDYGFEMNKNDLVQRMWWAIQAIRDELGIEAFKELVASTPNYGEAFEQYEFTIPNGEVIKGDGWVNYKSESTESQKQVKNTYRIGDRELKEYADGSMEIVLSAESRPYKSAWIVSKSASKSFPVGQVGELRMYENGEILIYLDNNLIIPFYDKALAKAYLSHHFKVYPKRPYQEMTVLMAEDNHDHDHDHDHEEIDELVEKINTVTDFAITFIHDGGFGGETKGSIVDNDLGLKTDIVEYVEGSLDLRMVRDIETNELLSVRFALSGNPDTTPILYLPLPEEIMTTPEDDRAVKKS